MSSQRYKNRAKQYFRAVYGGNPAAVEALAARQITSTYPVFARIFGTPVLHGRQAIQDFATRFGQRWADPEITFHESLQEGNSVVLVWSFQARRTTAGLDDPTQAGRVHRWGGITWIRFDDSGRIAAEIGEESDPGPLGRIQGG